MYEVCVVFEKCFSFSSYSCVDTGVEEFVNVNNVLKESPFFTSLNELVIRLGFRDGQFGSAVRVVAFDFIIDVGRGGRLKNGLEAEEFEVLRALDIVDVLNEILGRFREFSRLLELISVLGVPEGSLSEEAVVDLGGILSVDDFT